MAAPITSLEPFTSLGMAGIKNSGPYYVNDASIVYPTGNQIIQQSLDTGERFHILTSRVNQKNGSRHTKLTAFSVNFDGNYLALASTRNNDSPILVIYQLPSNQIYMSMPQENSDDIYFVGFNSYQSPNHLGLFLVSDPRKYRLTIFDLNIKTQTKSVSFTEKFETATFHPNHDNLIILYSKSCLGYLRANDDNVTNLTVPNYSIFSGFVFSYNEESVTVATSGRDVLFFSDMQLSYTMRISEDSPIIFITSFPHGFVLTTESYKLILIQHIPGQKTLSRIFQQGAVISYNISHPIVWSAFSPSWHQMILNVDFRQLIIVNIRELESSTESSIINPNILSHKGPVASISSCSYKPMLVSCGSEDKTVIVWDYSKQSALLHSEFAEDLIDVSFHPSGDLVAVASTDKLYLLSATVDSLVQISQWPLFNCLSIEFSNGGQFLVAASHIITFINPYTQEIIATLRGHTGLIHSISWSPDDKRLVSCGSDGAIVEWNAVNQEESWSINVPKSDFESAVINDRGTIIACSGSNIVHHLFNGRYQRRIYDSSNQNDNDIGFSAAFFATSSCIVLGDNLGGVLVGPFPFLLPAHNQAEFENIPQLEFSESQEVSKVTVNQLIPFVSEDIFKIHCGRVTSICSSLDSRILFSSAEDSSICIFNILTGSQVYNHSTLPILRCDVPKQQFFHISQSRFDELQFAIEKMKRDIQKQREQYEIDTIASLQDHQKVVLELTAQNDEKKAKLLHQIDSLKSAMDDSTVKAALIYQNMEVSHLNEAKALTNLYEQKLALERSKSETIAKELEDLKCSYEERIYLLRQQYKGSLQDFSDKVDNEQDQLTKNLELTRNRISESQEKQDQVLIDLELEFEKDRMAIDLEYHNKITVLNKTLADLEVKNNDLKKIIDREKADLDDLDGELKNMKEKRAELDKDIKALEHTQECRTSELNDRDETLIRQAERLQKLQSSNVELQKNKDIMEFRLEEMGKELQPSLDEIARLSTEYEGNSEEIRTIKRFTKAGHRTMLDKAHQIEVLKRKLELQNAALLKKKRVIQMFTVDLTEGVQKEDAGNKMKILKALHDKYVASHNLEETLKDANEAIDDNTRHRKHLQQSVMLLQRQIHQQQDITTKHFTGKSAENAVLLNDLNRLQKENRTLKKKVDNAKSDVEMLESNLKRFRQSNQDQKIKQDQRMAKTSYGPRVQKKIMGDWIQEQSTARATSRISVVDSRGKYIRSSKT
ncbi:hypothetical protein M9Y10_045762 [Tritrichomonas musculus]|uniref:Uncharacterized protein n=1 Tax=Tritrichomonas musculus TaxID=1915356 RepID=A0ABR2JW60_9EUKA